MECGACAFRMLLNVKDLDVTFHSRDGANHAVKGISYTLEKGEVIAIVGESGSGKSVSSMALTGLLPPAPSCQVSGSVELDGENLMQMREKELRKYRGRDIAYVFQEPSTALNPYFTVGSQIAEAIRYHRDDVDDVDAEVISLMDQVGIRYSDTRYRDYPHQMSGGMKQRIVIAMALACRPRILVADEPTTALDVTIEAQIISLLRKLKDDYGMAIVLITHNFGIVDGFADKVAVMFQGDIVEEGDAEEVLASPQHPYTQALIRCIPKLGQDLERLPVASYGLG